VGHNIYVRQATSLDSTIIAEHRAAMFVEIGRVATETARVQLREASEREIRTALSSGEYIGWLAGDGSVTVDGRDECIIGGVGLHLRPTLPRPSLDHLSVVTGPTPLVVDVYTRPEWRYRGVARMLMQEVLTWARDKKVDRVSLHASDAGRPLYEQLGFRATNEMRWSPI
jgi:GNAT superfamily N-acetyltransferase